jgi:hypothetical protein
MMWILICISVVVALILIGIEGTQREKRLKREWENEKLGEIQTSSTSSIHGRTIAKHLRLITHSGGVRETAEHEFLRKVRAAGGNGVIQMRVDGTKDGSYSIQGDAVIVEDAMS